MAYIWSPLFKTGHEIIDEQHRQLFDALNNIASAFRKGKGADEISKTLAFLVEYTLIHFSTEEELMENKKYPKYLAHKKCHDDFKVTAVELLKKFQEEGPSEDFIVNVTIIIGDWLISHIKIDDIKMVSYINSTDGFIDIE